MNLNKEEILEVLKFYSINDTDYINSCYKCIKFINNNFKIKEKVEEIYNILYLDKTNKIQSLWNKNQIDLFGNNTDPFITNILLLLGYKYHLENMKKFNLDNEQKSINIKRVKETLTNDIFIRKYRGIRISQMIWGAYFINIRIIETGRLQYEFSKYNPFINEKKVCIKIHIPKGEALEITKVKESIKNSKKEIEKYFHIKDYNYYCSSWLLSKQIKKIIPKESNIYKFQQLFFITEGEECKKDILNFVYNKETVKNYNNLDENTSLQRSIKKLLLNKEEINLGIGVLK